MEPSAHRHCPRTSGCRVESGCRTGSDVTAAAQKCRSSASRPHAGTQREIHSGPEAAFKREPNPGGGFENTASDGTSPPPQHVVKRLARKILSPGPETAGERGRVINRGCLEPRPRAEVCARLAVEPGTGPPPPPRLPQRVTARRFGPAFIR